MSSLLDFKFVRDVLAIGGAMDHVSLPVIPVVWRRDFRHYKWCNWAELQRRFGSYHAKTMADLAVATVVLDERYWLVVIALKPYRREVWRL